MELEGDGEVVVRHDGVEVALIAGPTEAGAALAFLDRVGSLVDAPVVDESERSRLAALAEGRGTTGHRAAVVRRGRRIAGYLGVMGGTDRAGGDLAVDRGDGAGEALEAGLAAAAELAAPGGARQLRVWLRRAAADDVERAVAAGFRVERRLAVLGRGLEEPPEPVPAPAGVTIRAYRPGDERAVVEVLAAAYAGTAEAGWDLDAFRARRGYDWFDPEDLLVAAERGGVAGLHWTKRRSETVGEVYNLAVSPRAQGDGLGAALLAAGLRHLHGRGVRDVLLWVDRANDRAVALYTGRGFATRWDDVALARELA